MASSQTQAFPAAGDEGSSVIDASSGTVRQVPIEQWRYVAAPTAP